MADKRISNLTEVDSLVSTDILPIVNYGGTKKIQVANLLASRVTSAYVGTQFTSHLITYPHSTYITSLIPTNIMSSHIATYAHDTFITSSLLITDIRSLTGVGSVSLLEDRIMVTTANSVFDTTIIDSTYFTLTDTTFTLIDSTIDHNNLTSLGSDAHTQYHNDARGDARYYTETELGLTTLDTPGAVLVGFPSLANTPTVNLRTITDKTQSSLYYQGGAISINASLDGRIDIASCLGAVKLSDSTTGDMAGFAIAASSAVSFASGTSFVCVEYTAATSSVAYVVQAAQPNHTTVFPIASVYKDADNHIHIHEGGHAFIDMPYTIQKRLSRVDGLVRGTGLVISEGTENLSLTRTVGYLYRGLIETYVNTYDTGHNHAITGGGTGGTIATSSTIVLDSGEGDLAGHLEYGYHINIHSSSNSNDGSYHVTSSSWDGSNTTITVEGTTLNAGDDTGHVHDHVIIYWHYDFSTTSWVSKNQAGEHSAYTIDVDYWNDIDNATEFQTYISNRYGCVWIYQEQDKHGSIHAIYGQGNYTRSEVLLAAPPSSVPDIISSFCVLIAKIVFQEGDSTLTTADIYYPWSTTFQASGATDHGGLAGLLNDDHSQYPLVDGSRGFTGSLPLGETTTPNSIANTGFIYAKDDSGDTELYFMDNGGDEIQLTKDAGLFTYLASCLDATIATPATVDFLAYNGSSWINTPFSAVGFTKLQSLSDVAIATPATVDQLLYNGSSWANTPFSGGGMTQFTVINSAVADGNTLVCSHTTLNTYSQRYATGVRYVAPADQNADITFTTETNYEQENVQGTAVHFEVDVANTSGHFEDVSNNAVSIGAGQDEVKIQIGTRLKFDGDATIYEITGASFGNVSVHVTYDTEGNYVQEDVKNTAVNFEVDTADTSGHFEDSGNSPVTIGPGNTEDRIVTGCRFYVDSQWLEITAITDAGEADDEVAFTQQDGVAASIDAGTYAVSFVYGTEFDSSTVILNVSGSGAETAWSDSINSNQTGYGNSTIRQVISAAGISASGNSIRVTMTAHTTSLCNYDNVAIVERSGSTDDGTTTPTEILFDGTSGTGDISAGGTKVSDWLTYSLDSAKSYLLIVDFSANNYWRRIDSGGYGYYFKANTNSYNTQNLSGTYLANRTAIFTKLEVKGSAYPLNQIYATTTNDSSRVSVAAASDINFCALTEDNGSETQLYAFSFDDRVTWGIWDDTGADEGWRPIARNNASTWEYNSNTTDGANDVTWTSADINSQERAISQAMEVTQNEMDGTITDGITDAQWENTDGAMNGFVAGVTDYINVAVGQMTTDDSVTPELSDVEIEYENSFQTVAFEQEDGSPASKAEDTYDVDWIRGSVVSGGKVQLNIADSKYPIDIFYTGHTADGIQIDSSSWTDIGDNAFTITDTSNDKILWYVISWDDRVTWRIWASDGWRPIARLNGATWEYNSNAGAGFANVTWTSATVNTIFGALEQAIGNAENQMSGSTLNGVSKANTKHADGGWSTSIDTVDSAWVMKTASLDVTPEIDLIRLSYVEAGSKVPFPMDNSSTDYSVVYGAGYIEVQNDSSETQNMEISVRV